MSADESGDTRMSMLFGWAIEFEEDPAMAAADWLARDIKPGCSSAVELLTSSDTDLKTLNRAKSVYKTLRIVGETSADRRLGGRLYACAIASALVFHGSRVSRQSDQALMRGFEELATDAAMPDALRDLAARAQDLLAQHGPKNGASGPSATG